MAEEKPDLKWARVARKWRGRLFSSALTGGGGCLRTRFDSLPMVFCQRLPKGVHQGDTVLEVEAHYGEEFRLEGGADATGFGISGGHRVGGAI